MKRFLYVFILIFPLYLYGQQSTGTENNNDTFSLKINLKEYKVASCLIPIFSSIEHTDSTHIRFPTDIYFYQVVFNNYINYKQLIVTPVRWAKYISTQYAGAFRIGSMYFLFMGNTIDPMFKATGKNIDETFTGYCARKYDSLDLSIKWYDWEHSPYAMVGIYRSCKGLPIRLYINVGKKIYDIETEYPTQSP